MLTITSVSNILHIHQFKAQSDRVSASKISKATAKKYQQLLENEKEYVVEKLLAVREGDDGDLEFFTKWEGYTQDHNTWEKLETFNGPLSELWYYCHFGWSVFLMLKAHNMISSHRDRGRGTEKEVSWGKTSQSHF